MEEKRYLNSELQKIELIKEELDGLILDIGGGGEGFVGQIYGKKCISIDKREDELLECENDSLKIVMDASQMTFVNESFEKVTCFFSLMYMDEDIKKKVLAEGNRVLKKGGVLEVWDSIVPSYDGGEKDIFLAHLEVSCCDKITKTTYGVMIEGKEQDKKSIVDILFELGMEEVEAVEIGESFKLKFRKVK